MTEFRILGPVEVHDGRTGRRVVPSGTKQRTLLAALVVEAGRTLTVDRLADELWGDEPPQRAANAVQAHVARLRRMLSDSGDGDWISTEPMGYLLRLGSATTDAQRFQRLSAEGRAAASTDPAHATELLERALAVWRGPALQDCLRGPLCAAEAERFEEHRLATLEKLYETRLHETRLRSAPLDDVTGELERLTYEHPLRERFYDLSMVALCLAGRPAEALGVYERARKVLLHMLGVEPGPALRARMEATIRHSPFADLGTTPPPRTLAHDASGGTPSGTPGGMPGSPSGSTPSSTPGGISDVAALLDLGGTVARLRERVDELSREQGTLLRRIDELAAAAGGGAQSREYGGAARRTRTARNSLAGQESGPVITRPMPPAA
ncbi:AfsR/SARP family transcriptional regulator [Streptomyces sp. NBC_00378]|uniref:AfsR/SARP family transcriptional regulator n=1 Tax=unclassified Streptomyces TaxID=2593676 RepID=UPI0022511F06|nr:MULTISPECIES: AfsR/SARP family transcriptional regulator [unclassified Streptomyces]MCX5115061.1 AfsR/SARP family transcriptional regulator [Streptomyces sp. NBC_00378]